MQDERLIDSNRYICPRVFCVSANVSSTPQSLQLWTNYNYPPSSGLSTNSYRINTAKAVRSTSAAPAYFTAVNLDNCRYADGAIIANNPTDIAMREARKLFNEDIELILSIGTGMYKADSPTYEWFDIVGHIIVASTDTERVHEIIEYFHGQDKYFRLNPPLNTSISIDAKEPEKLAILKHIGKEYVTQYANEHPKEMERLAKILRN